MQIEPMKGLEDVLLIKPDLHEDQRGYFYEVFNEREFNEKTGNKYDFHALQENESKSTTNVFRGLHFQNKPYEQAKLVRVLKGAVLDFAIDIRKDSPTFGTGVCVLLTEENKHQLFVPRGFAHGFWVVSTAIFEYKCDNYYNKESEGGIRWDDEDVKVIVGYRPDGTCRTQSVQNVIDELNQKLGTRLKLSEKDLNRTTTLKDL